MIHPWNRMDVSEQRIVFTQREEDRRREDHKTISLEGRRGFPAEPEERERSQRAGVGAGFPERMRVGADPVGSVERISEREREKEIENLHGPQGPTDGR